MSVDSVSISVFGFPLSRLRNAGSSSGAMSTAQPSLSGSVLMGASRMLRSSLKECSDGNATLHAA